MSSDNAHLFLENITFSHNGRALIQDLTLNFEKGSFSVILGGSGSGKTILLKIIGGILFPDNGRIVLDEIDTEHLSEAEEKQLRQKTSFVFQDGALLSNLTVRENLMLPLDFHFPGIPKADKMEAISGYLNRYSHADIMEKRPAELSQAQKKLSGFIRALLTRPEILLIDEPLASVDPTSSRLIIQELVKQKSQKTTIIVGAQSLDRFEKWCDRVLIFQNGKVLEEGSPEQVRKSENPVTKELLHID